jgi:acyl-[acyl carrier protein]--UDP-N-acetylglucosamine O-acyltransferase
VRALNTVGLRRRGIGEESIAALERAFRVLFASGRTRREAVRDVEGGDPLVAKLLEALDRTG